MIRLVRYLHDTIVQVRSSSRASLARFNAKPIGVGPNTAPSTGFDWLIISEKSSLHTNFRGLTNFRPAILRPYLDSDNSVKMAPNKHQASVKTYAIPAILSSNTPAHAVCPLPVHFGS